MRKTTRKTTVNAKSNLIYMVIRTWKFSVYTVLLTSIIYVTSLFQQKFIEEVPKKSIPK